HLVEVAGSRGSRYDVKSGQCAGPGHRSGAQFQDVAAADLQGCVFGHRTSLPIDSSRDCRGIRIWPPSDVCRRSGRWTSDSNRLKPSTSFATRSACGRPTSPRVPSFAPHLLWRGCAVANRAAHATEHLTRVFDDAHGEVGKPTVEQLQRTSVRLSPWA